MYVRFLYLRVPFITCLQFLMDVPVVSIWVSFITSLQIFLMGVRLMLIRTLQGRKFLQGSLNRQQRYIGLNLISNTFLFRDQLISLYIRICMVMCSVFSKLMPLILYPFIFVHVSLKRWFIHVFMINANTSVQDAFYSRITNVSASGCPFESLICKIYFNL